MIYSGVVSPLMVSNKTKVWHLLTEGTPRDMYQRKIRLERLKEECGLESLLLRGIGVEENG